MRHVYVVHPTFWRAESVWAVALPTCSIARSYSAFASAYFPLAKYAPPTKKHLQVRCVRTSLFPTTAAIPSPPNTTNERHFPFTAGLYIKERPSKQQTYL